jgi:hypothetical protein
MLLVTSGDAWVRRVQESPELPAAQRFRLPQLKGYSTSAGAVRFEIGHALPAPLVEKLITVRLQQAFPDWGSTTATARDPKAPPAAQALAVSEQPAGPIDYRRARQDPRAATDVVPRAWILHRPPKEPGHAKNCGKLLARISSPLAAAEIKAPDIVTAAGIDLAAALWPKEHIK